MAERFKLKDGKLPTSTAKESKEPENKGGKAPANKGGKAPANKEQASPADKADAEGGAK